MPYPSTLSRIDIPMVDIWSFMFDRTTDFPDNQPGFIDANTNKVLTQADVREQSKRFGIGLKSLWDWKKGDILALFSPNHIDTPIVVFGTLWAGGVISPPNPAYTVDELTFQLQDSGARAICTIPALLPIAKAAAINVGIANDRIILLGDEPSSGWPENHKPFRDIFDPSTSINWIKPKIHPEKDLAYLVYSSGTTGKPKGVMTSHTNVIANVLQILAVEGKEFHWSRDKVIAFLPFFHIYGLTCIIHQAFYIGLPTIVMDRFDLEKLLGNVQKHTVTYMHAVPPIVLLLAKHPVVEKYDLSSIRMINCGAAPLTKDLVQAVHKRLGLKIKQGYGLSETSPVTHLQQWDDWQTAMGSCGKLVSNMDAKCMSEDGKELEPSKAGELWVKGPNVMVGYWKNPQATKDAITEDGYFKTGDIGYADKDGHFYITDRVKELIKYNGFQVPPAELEGVIQAHPNVDDVCVTGIYNETLASEVPRAYIVLAKGVEASKASEEDIMKFVESRVAPHKRLRGGVRFISEIPKSASGKILRRILKAAAAEEEEKGRGGVKAKL